MELSLSDDERALLLDLLDAAYRNLKDEISNTDTSRFKEELKARERLLVGLLEKVRQQATEVRQ